jgi:hypothetical protein
MSNAVAIAPEESMQFQFQMTNAKGMELGTKNILSLILQDNSFRTCDISSDRGL